MRLRLLAVTAGMLSAGSLASGADWPQWRGPDRNEVSKETGLNTNWKEKKPKLLWTFKEAGEGYTAPAIIGNTLYSLGTADGNDFAFALDVGSGQQIWHQVVGKAYKHARGSGARGTPTVDGEALYFIGGAGDVHCLDTKTGKPRWQKSLTADLGGRLMSGWGYSESPLVDGEKLVCTPGGSDGSIVALNKNTGGVMWRCKEVTDAASYSSVIAADVAGVRQYIQLTDKGAAGVRAGDGQLLWFYPRSGHRVAVIPTAIYRDNHVYVTAGYGCGCDLIKLTPAGEDKFNAEKVYANKNMVNHHGGVVLLDGFVYGYSDNERGNWVCQDFKTGDTVWKEKKLGKGALTYAAGHLFCHDENTGATACVKASSKGWQETGRLEVPEKSKIRTQDNKFWTHPVIANGKLYLRHQDLLFCFDLK